MAFVPPQMAGAGMGAGAAGVPPKIPLPESLEKIEWINSLAQNQLFTAGFGLVGIGAIASFLRVGSTSLQEVARRRMLVSLEIPSSDYSYSWVMQWLVNKRAEGFGRGGGWHHRGVQTTYTKDAAGRTGAVFDFVPSPGQHWIHLGGFNFLKVDRQRETKTVDLSTGTPWETLTLTTLSWPLGPRLFSEILHEASELAQDKEEGKTIIYNAMGHEWRQFGQPKAVRPYSSVILHDRTADQVAQDVDDFLNAQNWYLDRGIPYRRGYLLHGPPGCGKSSYVLALAGRLKYNIAVLNLGDPSFTDDRMQHLLAVVPPRTIILIEDIDQAANEEPDAERDVRFAGATRVTFSGLLNALDGVTATEERIVFMTTNKFQILPPALIRPGRVDIKVYIGLASRNQCSRMFRRFYPEASEELEIQFCDGFENSGISMAELQGYFLFFKNHPEAAVQQIPSYIATSRAASVANPEDSRTSVASAPSQPASDPNYDNQTASTASQSNSSVSVPEEKKTQ